MPRYIDADKLIGYAKRTYEAQSTTAGQMQANDFLTAINFCHSANVIEVVRCKECKWLLPHKCIEGYDGNCDLSGCEVYNDDYCSRGEISNERKD